MTQHIHEDQLALYATGDLAPGIEDRVAAHVHGCESCQATVAGFRDAQSLVLSTLIDPGADELAEVRERVSASLGERRVGRWWWAWPAVGAAAIITLIVAGIGHRPVVSPEPAGPVAQLTPPELPQLETPHLQKAVLRRPRVRHREAGIRSVDLIARADQPMLIKMTTADPNVVILWQSNGGVKNE
jgi:hypothetical protein